MYDAYNFRFIPGYNEKSVFGNESIIRAAFGIADGTSIKDDAETYYATVDPVKFTTGGGVETTYVDFSQGFFSMTVVTYKKDNQPAEYVDSSDPSNNFMLYKSPMAVSNINMSLVNINTAFAAHRTAKWAPVRWKGAASDGTYDPTSKVDKDDDGKWAMYVKPEAEKGFAIYPESGDIGRFFAASKMEEATGNRIKTQLAQKYYDLATKDPSLKVDLFTTREKDVDLSLISKVNVVKTKDDRIVCAPVIEGVGKPEPREVSQSQWQRLWMAEDKVEYKRNLAATLFADVLRQQKQAEAEKQQEEKRMNSPEQKAKEEREEKPLPATSTRHPG